MIWCTLWWPFLLFCSLVIGTAAVIAMIFASGPRQGQLIRRRACHRRKGCRPVRPMLVIMSPLTFTGDGTPKGWGYISDEQITLCPLHRPL